MKRLLLVLMALCLVLTSACFLEEDDSTVSDSRSSTTFTVVTDADFAAIEVQDVNDVHSVRYAFGTVEFNADVERLLRLCTELGGEVYNSLIQAEARSSAQLVLRIPHEESADFLAELERDSETRIRLYFKEESGEVSAQLATARSTVASKKAAVENLQRIIDSTTSSAELMAAEDSIEALYKEIETAENQIAAYETMEQYCSFTVIVRAPTLDRLSTGDGTLVNLNERLSVFGTNITGIVVVVAAVALVVVAIVISELMRRRRSRRRRRKRKVHSESPNDVQAWQRGTEPDENNKD